MQKIVTSVCIVENDKLLMAKQAHSVAYGLWDLPAGHLDHNENIIIGAIRETKEETGYDVKITSLISIQNIMENNNQVIRFVFMAEIISGTIQFNKNEISEVSWISFGKLEKMTNKELRAFDSYSSLIKKIKENKTYPLEIINDFI